jgi:hypothetical protein
MKIPILNLFFLVLLFARTGRAQVTFTMTYSLCEGNTATVTANTGTFSASSYTWSSNPAGPVFSASLSSHTGITFPLAGTYTITVAATSGTNVGSASNTIIVYPSPAVTLTSSSATVCTGQDATLTASGASNYTWEPLSLIFIISASAAYVSPNSAAVYTVWGTNSQGCVGSNTCAIYVDPYPNIGLINTSTAVCAGFQSTLTALGAASYSWTGTTFTGTVNQATIVVGPGSYSVTGANGNCRDTSEIQILQAPPLALTVTRSRPGLCLNRDEEDPVILSASGADTYVWSPYVPGYMSYSIGPITAVSPTTSTCYTLIASTTECTASTVVCVQVSTCTSIGELAKGKKYFSLFPNPVRDELSVYSEKPGGVFLEISDVFGNAILREEKYFDGTTSRSIYTGSFARGIYFIKIGPVREVPQILRFIKE